MKCPLGCSFLAGLWKFANERKNEVWNFTAIVNEINKTKKQKLRMSSA
jgi:hypothetical protein